MFHRCALETDDRLGDQCAGISEAQRIPIITAATGELSRRWTPPAGAPDSEGPGAEPAVPRVSAVETVRTRGHAVREDVLRATPGANEPLAGSPRHVRLQVLAAFLTTIVVCGVIAASAYALPVP